MLDTYKTALAALNEYADQSNWIQKTVILGDGLPINVWAWNDQRLPWVMAQVAVEGLDDKQIGAGLRRKRKQAGVEMKAVAAQLNISVSHLSDLERGQRHWSPERVSQYCQYLGMLHAE